MKILKRLKKIFFPSQFDKSVALWFKTNGDKTYRLNYPSLDKQSVVFDIGGYLGDFASDIYSKYLCKIFVLEPVNEFYEFIQNRFASNINITVLPYGTGIENKTINISKFGASSSIYRQINKASYETIIIKNIIEIFNENSISKIDLLKINIEGGEFEVLDLIIESGWIDKISNLQIQFHRFVKDSYAKRNALQEKLSLTHTKTYDYYFVWENWKKN